MARRPSSEPTQRELEILHVLWESGGAELGTICTALRRGRPVATSTVATMLGVMLDKKLVRRTRGPRGYRWSARVSRKNAASGLLESLIDRAFDGSAGRLVAHLLEDSKLSPGDVDEIRRLLDEHRRRKRSSTPRA